MKNKQKFWQDWGRVSRTNGDWIFIRRNLYESSINILINKNEMIYQVMQQNITKIAQVCTAKQETATNIIGKKRK